jgi:ataxia telangiectasia mutated family protein
MPLRDTQILLKQQARNNNLEEKVKVFLKITREFRPVLRHFFTESNKQPVVWYAKRLTYSRSVATCAIGRRLVHFHT